MAHWKEKCVFLFLQCVTIMFVVFLVVILQSAGGPHKRRRGRRHHGRKSYIEPVEDNRLHEMDPDCQCKSVVAKNQTTIKVQRLTKVLGLNSCISNKPTHFSLTGKICMQPVCLRQGPWSKNYFIFILWVIEICLLQWNY